MFIINQITADPLQTQNLILPDGTQIIFQIQFVQQQQGWFFNSLQYDAGNFLITGMRICNSPNMLHQFRNLIPFGMACYSVANREPSLLQDFISQNSKLYILTAQEVAAYANTINGL
jgi:hypothetical protein